MNRRDFLAASTTIAATYPAAFAAARAAKLRVGLIGCGWYGKCDLFRLIQVAPVEVVSLCDVDKKMLAEAAEMVAERPGVEEEAADLRRLPRDAQGEGPRHRPDRHARPLARPADDRRRRGRGRRLRAEADQRRRGRRARRWSPPPASTSSVVQVGTQRRSTPHLIEARDKVVEGGQARQDRPWSRSTATTTCGPTTTRRTRSRPSTSTTRCGPAPPRCGPTTPRTDRRPLPHRRWWRAFMEYGNGIVGDMCIHMLDMVRWMLDLGWPKRDQLHRRHPRAEGEQVEHLRHADRHLRLRRLPGRLAAPHLGRVGRPGVPLGARPSTATRARSRLSVNRYDFIPLGPEQADAQRHGAVRGRQVPRGQDREGPGAARRPGHPRAHARLPEGPRRDAASRSPTSSRGTSRRRAASWPTCRCNSAAR